MKLFPTQADLARSRVEISREGDGIRVRVPAIDVPIIRYFAFLLPVVYLLHLESGGIFFADGKFHVLMFLFQIFLFVAVVFSNVHVWFLFKGASQNAILSDGVVRYFRQDMRRHSAIDIKAAEISSVTARERSAVAKHSAQATRYTVAVGRNGAETELFTGLNQGDAERLAALFGQFVAAERDEQPVCHELRGGAQL